MTTEIIKGIIAVIIFIAAIASVFIGDGNANAFLVPLATFIFGYYFKQVEVPVMNQIAKARTK